MQIRIALCDDSLLYREIVTNLLQEYRRTAFLPSFALSCFSSGEELLDYVDENGTFDLYLLEVLLTGINGIQLGGALRKRKDPGIIIYVTASADFAVDSYQTDALYYLLKPINRSQFFSCLDKAVQRLQRAQTEVISIKTPSSTRIVPLRNILFAERQNRRVRYYLSDNTVINSVTFSGAFHKAAAPLLADSGFLAVGSSFVVNLCHVIEITKSEMLFTSGQLVPIPRRSYETVKSKWTKYWFPNGDRHMI